MADELGFAMFGAFLLFYIVFMIALYIYVALALMTMAKKTNVENGWLAFIPIANLYIMTQIGGVPWWTIFLTFIPLVSVVVWFYWWWKIAEVRNKPGWWALLLWIPIVNLILIGLMAWQD